MLRNDQPGSPPELNLYPKPEGIRTIRMHTPSFEERLNRGWRQDMLTLFDRFPFLLDAVRNRADQAYLQKRRLEVLDLADTIPFKGLAFHHGDRIDFGDTLIEGRFRHPAPQIRTTFMSGEDYVARAVGSEGLNLQNKYVEDATWRVIYSAMGVRKTTSFVAERHKVDEAYQRKKEEGETLVVDLQPDPVAGMRNAYARGERYDFIFPELPATLDRMNYLQIVQALLKQGGVAVVPLAINYLQHSPRHYGLGKMEIFLDDQVITGDTIHVPLAEHLAQQFPDAYEIINGRVSSKMLLIKGTPQPVQLPEFRVWPQMSEDTDVSLLWRVRRRRIFERD
jgi:hypothetical protein